jgi:hypothetical protein
MRIGPAGRYAVILAIATVLVSLAACGGGSSGPATLPALSSSVAGPTPTATVASPVATPSPTTPPTPSGRATRKAELAAATAVVRRYYAIANELRTHMDAGALAMLFTRSCPCQQQVRAIRAAAARHEHYIDQARLNVLRPELEGTNTASVLVDFDAGRGGLATRSGRQVTSAPAKNHVRRVFRLERTGARWLIFEIDAVR